MDILKGLFYINGVDVYEKYGAFLSEDKQGGTANYSSLLKPPAVKVQKEVSVRERNGVDVPTTIVQTWQARDISLQFTIVADDGAAFLARYRAFIAMLITGNKGWLDLYLPELDRHFNVYYKESSNYKQLTDFEGEVGGKFYVKFREPKPNFE